ncbi:hypothetical protein BH10PLA1_BH10PLA1_13110 [soil metagenome]
MKICAFLLPLAVWSVISYVPWVCHPMMRITEPGDSGYRVMSYIKKDDYAAMNASAIEDDQKPMIGVPANPYWLPAPHDVVRALYTAFTTAPINKGDPWLHESLGHSLKMIFWGFGIAAIIAVPVGLVCGTFDVFSKLGEPFFDFIRYMPPPAFSLLLLGIFGLDDEPKIALIVIATFFPMVLVVANTARNLDPALLEAAQTLGADRRRLLTRVVLPGVLANLYNDLRIMIGASWTALMIAELIGEKSGLSRFISQQARYQHYDNVYAGIILIGMIGLITDQLLQFIGQFLFPWQAKPINSLSRSVMAFVTFVPRKMIGLVRRPKSNSSERVQDVSVA